MSYLRKSALDETNFPLFAGVKEAFGFIPNLYRAQLERKDLIEAEAGLVNAVLLNENALSRRHKEYIFLVCSAANMSTYCVTAHCEIVRMLGIEGPEPEQVAIDHASTNLPLEMKALLNFAARLNSHPAKIGKRDIDVLRTYGYTDEQILEAVLTVGVAKFANSVSFGLGTAPDFENPRIALRAPDAA
jgi:uncharacterized peroxidase-related enzyme